MGGDDAIPRPVRARAMIYECLEACLTDPEGALKPTLKQWIADDVRVSRNLDTPLVALDEILRSLSQPPELYEFARAVNMKWGEIYGDRPRFQQPGQPPHPDTAYTHEGLQQTLTDMLKQL